MFPSQEDFQIYQILRLATTKKIWELEITFYIWLNHTPYLPHVIQFSEQDNEGC